METRRKENDLWPLHPYHLPLSLEVCFLVTLVFTLVPFLPSPLSLASSSPRTARLGQGDPTDWAYPVKCYMTQWCNSPNQVSRMPHRPPPLVPPIASSVPPVLLSVTPYGFALSCDWCGFRPFRCILVPQPHSFRSAAASLRQPSDDQGWMESPSLDHSLQSRVIRDIVTEIVDIVIVDIVTEKGMKKPRLSHSP